MLVYQSCDQRFDDFSLGDFNLIDKLRRAALITSGSMIASVASAAPMTSAAPVVRSVPVSSLVSEVSIPHSMFKLKNGLTVIVHEDHKAPVAAVTVWYNVGSKDDPRAKPVSRISSNI